VTTSRSCSDYSDSMKPFREISAEDADASKLNRELEAHGYTLIRGVLPADSVHGLLGEVLDVIREDGWLLPDSTGLLANPSAACGESDARFKAVYERIFGLEAFHALAHHPALQRVMNLLVGPRLLIHPKPIARVIFPNCERFVIDAHQDHQSVAGDAGCFTAWMPLHDCPPELGPLQILENSHRFGLQEIDPETGIIAKDTAQGTNWVGGAIYAGDVLLFSDLTVHAASKNTSNQLRISMDCRFQDYARAVNPANLVFPGVNARSWAATYAQWSADELQFFWQRLPLTLKPSIPELAELAETADKPQTRMRYIRILQQIELQTPNVWH
jgi:ectoine hydroxylase-related dioxygenase (phytanoyl-CoA dioxygenase family)